MNKPVRRGPEAGIILMDVYRLLEKNCDFGKGWPRGEWPITGRFIPRELEVVIGAVLTQNTRWENVETALARMAEMGLTTARSISMAGRENLQRSIQSSGFFRQKAETLIDLASRWQDTGGVPPAGVSREELLGINRIGPETADTILLFVRGRIEFIADAYARRLVSRIGRFEPPFDYRSVKQLYEVSLPPLPSLYMRYHALIVQHARDFCRKTPRCTDCPLSLSELCLYPDDQQVGTSHLRA